jgi:hypothetical protein
LSPRIGDLRETLFDNLLRPLPFSHHGISSRGFDMRNQRWELLAVFFFPLIVVITCLLMLLVHWLFGR